MSFGPTSGAAPVAGAKFAASVSGTTITLSPSATINVGDVILIEIAINAASGATACTDNSTQAGTANAYTRRTVRTGTTFGYQTIWCIATRSILTTDTITITVASTSRRAATMTAFRPSNGNAQFVSSPSGVTNDTTSPVDFPATGVLGASDYLVWVGSGWKGAVTSAGTAYGAFAGVPWRSSVVTWSSNSGGSTTCVQTDAIWAVNIGSTASITVQITYTSITSAGGEVLLFSDVPTATQTPVSATVNVAATPSMSQQVGMTKSVPVTGSPSISKQVAQARSVSVTASPSLVKRIGIPRAVNVTGTPTYSQSIRRGVVALVTVTGTPSLSKRLAISRTSAVTGTPSISKRVGVTRSVAVTGTPSVFSSLARSVQAAVSVAVTPTMQKALGLTRSVSATAAPTLQKRISLSRAVQVTGTPSLSKRVSFSRAVSVLATPTFSMAGQIYQVVQSVAVTVTPSLRKMIAASRGVSVTASPSLQKQLQVTRSTTVAVQPSMSKRILLNAAVTAVVSPGLAKRYAKTAAVTVTGTASANIVKPTQYLVNATVTVAATVAYTVAKKVPGGTRIARKIRLRSGFNIN